MTRHGLVRSPTSRRAFARPGPPGPLGSTDEQLVVAAQAGDRAALDQLLRRHHDRIHALCRRITGNDTDALDATQEALIAVVRGLHRFDGRAAFGTWCYRIATNACLDELRRRRRRPTVGLPDHEVRPASTGPAVDGGVVDRLAIDDAMAGLPAEFRAAVVLRDLCQLDYAEIAEVLGIPAGTVRSRIARGRGALASTFGLVGAAGNPAPAGSSNGAVMTGPDEADVPQVGTGRGARQPRSSTARRPTPRPAGPPSPTSPAPSPPTPRWPGWSGARSSR